MKKKSSEPGREMIRILQIAKRYSGNYSLFNDMVQLDSKRFLSSIFYLEGSDDGKNDIERYAAKAFYMDDLAGEGRGFLAKVLMLKSIIESEKIDIVNCQLEKTLATGVVAALLARNRPRIVTTIHGLVGGSKIRLSKKIKNFLFFRFLDRIVSVSKSIKTDVLRVNWGLKEKKVTAVQNGLEYDRFMQNKNKDECRAAILPDCPFAFWFGTVGRLVEKKNHKNVILGFSRLVKVVPDCGLIIVGDGPLEASLKSLVASLNIDDNVLFLGKRGDVPDILNALDVFVFPTYREGLPLAMLEAMASGLPILGSDIPVVREVFGDEEIGLTADPDDPDEIFQAMLKMTNMSAGKLEQCGANARRRAIEDFSAVRMRNAYEDLYEEICSA